MSWNTPKTWISKDELTTETFNKELYENMLYLFKPPRDEETNRQDTFFLFTTTSTTPVAPTGVKVLSINIVTDSVEIWWSGNIAADSANRIVRADVWVDNSYYLSSLTGTQLTEGIWAEQLINSGTVRKFVWKVVLDGLAPGTHTFQLRVWISAGTLWLGLHSYQWGVKEI